MSVREIFQIPRLDFAINLRARARQASTRFVPRRERAAFFIGKKTCFLAGKRIRSNRSFLAAASAIVIAGPIQTD